MEKEEDMQINGQQEDAQLLYVDETKYITEKLNMKAIKDMTIQEEKKGISATKEDDAEDVYKNTIHVNINNEDLNGLDHNEIEPYNCALEYKHRGVRNFSCGTCQKEFTNKNELYEHLRQHSEAKPYECSLCDFKTAYRDYIKKHFISQHENCEIFSCLMCEKVFKNKAHLNKHIHKHKEKMYECDLCDYIATRKWCLQRHTKDRHSEEENVSCKICKKKFASNSILNIHLRTHTGQKRYKCDLCDYKSRSKSVITKHMKFKHGDRKDYLCYICQKLFVTIGYLNRHLRTHREEPHNCDWCDYQSSSKTAITKHIQRKHGYKRKGKCHVCQKNFPNNSALDRHLRVHTGEKPYECDLCGYTAAAKYTLIKHLERNHSENNRFVCHICHKILKSEVSLNKHLTVHNSEKPYKCDLCDFTARIRSNIIKHLKHKHSGKKNYVCHICQDIFTSKALLNRHLNVHTGEKPYLI